MTDHPHDTLSEWELAVSCLRVEVEAGRKLTPSEMLAAVDSGDGPHRAPERSLAE